MTRRYREAAGLGEIFARQRRTLAQVQELASRRFRRIPLPSRFRAKKSGDQVTIRDTRTDRKVTIPYCEFASAKKVLDGLFGL